jgi:Fe-S cluster assembly protein SufD
MATRKVITRTHKAGKRVSRDFNFSREMMPVLSGVEDTARFVTEYRNRAWEAFEQFPMPTTNDEAWRRTDIRNLDAGVFELASTNDNSKFPDPPRELLKPLVGSQHGGQIVLTSGDKSWVELNVELASKGVIFTDLRSAEAQHSELLTRMLGQVVRPDEGKFAALAASMARLGVLVYVPKGVHVDKPLHSVLWGPGNGLAYFSHILVWLEDDASLTYVHEAASPTNPGEQTLHSGIVELHVGAGSNLRFVELQSWGEQVWNFNHERARVARDGNLDWIYGAMGSSLTKNFSDMDLAGEGASGRMSGFYFTDGKQHLDLDTQQNHLSPHTTSDLLFKGALRDESRSVWQGMIYVAPGAQKTDGYQANRNLTLSPKSRADSIPGLEILADDVRCTHGATIGKIDPDLIFYLQSRGLTLNDAERLVVEGFFDPIMQRIPFEGVRERFQQAIRQKMV